METKKSAAGAAPCGVIDLYAAYAKKEGLTLQQFRVLEAVGMQPECTQAALCVRLGVSKQRVNLLVRELAATGFLSFEKDPADGRRKRIRLAPRGEAALGAFGDENGAPDEGGGHTHTHVLPDGTTLTHTHGHGHGHTHENTKAVCDRLARCAGHLEKVRRMVEEGVDCSEVLIQLSAVKAAVNNAGKLILKDHIAHCVVDAIECGDSKTIDDLNRAIDQFIK